MNCCFVRQLPGCELRGASYRRGQSSNRHRRRKNTPGGRRSRPVVLPFDRFMAKTSTTSERPRPRWSRGGTASSETVSPRVLGRSATLRATSAFGRRCSPSAPPSPRLSSPNWLVESDTPRMAVAHRAPELLQGDRFRRAQRQISLLRHRGGVATLKKYSVLSR